MTGAERIASAGWEPPTPFHVAAEPPPFPTGTLPAWIGDYVEALAESTQTPPGMAGVLALGAIASLTGRRIEVQARPDWIEPTNLYVCVLAPPAERKSAVSARVLAPVRAHEANLIEATEPARLEATENQAVLQRAHKRALDKAGNLDGPDRVEATREVQDLAAQVVEAEPPPRPCLIVDESTPEHVRATLIEQGGRLTVASDEGGPIDMLTRYSKDGPKLTTFLAAHTRDTPLVGGTIGRGSHRVDRPALTVALAVQPDVFAKAAGLDGAVGRGFIARFLWAKPPSKVGRRLVNPPPIPDKVAARYAAEMGALANFLESTFGNGDTPKVLHLGPIAADALDQFRTELEPRLDPKGGDLANLAGWAGKLAGAVVRIAGLLHIAARFHDGIGTPVTGDTMAAAIKLGRYFLGHAQAVLGSLTVPPEVAKAAAMLEVIERKRLDQFTAADLWRQHLSRGYGHWKSPTDRDEALRTLVEYGWLRREGKVYETNPAAWSESGSEWKRVEVDPPGTPGAETPAGNAA